MQGDLQVGTILRHFCLQGQNFGCWDCSAATRREGVAVFEPLDVRFACDCKLKAVAPHGHFVLVRRQVTGVSPPYQVKREHTCTATCVPPINISCCVAELYCCNVFPCVSWGRQRRLCAREPADGGRRDGGGSGGRSRHLSARRQTLQLPGPAAVPDRLGLPHGAAGECLPQSAGAGESAALGTSGLSYTSLAVEGGERSEQVGHAL